MTALQKNKLDHLLNEIERQDMSSFLQYISLENPGRVTFSTSFSFEDQLITDTILRNDLPISIFTLDTGRMFTETYSVWNNTNEKYRTHIKAYYPNQSAIENFVAAKGPNAFYESVQNRKDCCFIRKVEPLKRALAGNDIWITGLRAEHSSGRSDLQLLEWDEGNQIIKYHPLLHWTTEQVRDYIGEHDVPYNPLHDKGFVSIGCAPCTRAIQPGEDFRAGRWWWEDADKKECGLHVHEAKL
ncbi:MAG: phosphoadenylyl-sulfate reductase [Ferruginibacter sp.]